MSDIAIVTDSVSCLNRELLDQYSIEVIPFTLFAGGKAYRDGVDITTTQAYELFLKDPDSFKTAPSTPRDCLAVFQKISQKAKNILLITVSTKISTFFNVARIARELAQEELKETRIEIIDSQTAAAAQGFVVLAAARAVESGKNFEEVIEAVRDMIPRVNAIVLLETVRNVYRSGRVPKIAAQAASVLNIHPLFSLYGSVNFVTASMSKKIGIQRMLKFMRNKVDGNPVHCAVMHAYAPEEAQALQKRIALEFNCVELWASEFSPIMGYATGTGTLGVAFYADF
jgi:DegV family protein with EDD domain